MSLATDPRYPIGNFEPKPYDVKLCKKLLTELSFLPTDIELAIQNLDAHQLDTPYREGGWTVKQLVHHVADSHMNALIRCKLALTEDNPTIKPYNEKAWALLDDISKVPVNVSITMLHTIHRRWVAILEDQPEASFLDRGVVHPEHQKHMSLWYLLGMYVWHGKHHLAHITTLKEQRGW